MAETDVITFGCRLNAVESEVMRQRARAAGLDDAVIVNTCTVTAEAVRQARQAIRKLRRERPTARIIVTGCAAQVDPEIFAAMPEVDRVLGNREKLAPAAFAPAQFARGNDARVQVSDVMALIEPDAAAVERFEGRTRAFVQIQQGCDHRCTFCIIPFARGPNLSLTEADLVERVRRLVANGYAEIVLTGVDIASYGVDRGGRPALAALVRRLLADVPALQRLRLSSLDPGTVEPALFDVFADEPRLMPHIHWSLQAGDDTVLKRMKRRHSRAAALEACERARAARPEIVFGADLIAGFPTETEAMHERSVSAIAELDLTFLHVFPYSPRPGTPAGRMPQVPAAIRRERAARLRAAGEAQLRRHLAGHVGRNADVLIEAEQRGRAADYSPVQIDFAAPAGAVVTTRIHGATAHELVGTRVP